MFITQINTPKFRFYLYLPFLVGFVLLSLMSFLSSDGTQAKSVVDAMILQHGKNLVFVIMLLPFAVFLLLLLLWVKMVHKQTITSLTTARPKIDFKRFLFAFSVSSAVFIFLFLVQYLISPELFVLTFNLVPFLQFLVLVIILLPLQTGFEEYFFRGYLMQGIGVATRSRIFALCFTAVFFGIMHFSSSEVDEMGPIIYIYYIGTGLFLGIITLLDDGIELAWGFHTAVNLFGFLLVSSESATIQTNSIFQSVSNLSVYSDVLFPVLVIYPLLFFIYSRKYGWKNWKEKLDGKNIKHEQHSKI